MTFAPDGPSPAPATTRHRLIGGVTIALAGLALIVSGTFLPWLVSGGVQRNSYAIVGIVRRLGFAPDGLRAAAVDAWPLIGPLAILPVLAGIVRWWRTAGTLALVYGLLAGLISGGVMAVAGGHRAAGVALAATGPTVTLIGAAITAVGAGATVWGARRKRVHVSPEPESVPVRRNPHRSLTSIENPHVSPSAASE